MIENLLHIELNIKEQVVELAKEWPLYFSQLIPATGHLRHSTVQFIGISHSGIRLINKSEDKTGDDVLTVLEHFKYKSSFFKIKIYLSNVQI